MFTRASLEITLFDELDIIQTSPTGDHVDSGVLV